VDFKERDVPAQRMEAGGKRERQRGRGKDRAKEVGTGSQALQLTRIGQTIRMIFLLFCLSKTKCRGTETWAATSSLACEGTSVCQLSLIATAKKVNSLLETYMVWHHSPLLT